MSSVRILMVEHAQELDRTLERCFSTNGIILYHAGNGTEATELFEAIHPDLVILDIPLPDRSGFEVCRELRRISLVPILFYSEGRDDDTIIKGLESGADGYVFKPCPPKVLLARIKAIIRRLPPKKHELSFENFSINLSTYEIIVNGEKVILPAKERQILMFLARHPNKVFTLEQLYSEIWGSSSFGDNRTVLVHISNLRRKLGDPSTIQTVRGKGYMLKV